MTRVRDAALHCRRALELGWTMCHRTGTFPQPPPGRAPSHGCCIHSAFLLEWWLDLRVPEIAWRVAGGERTLPRQDGGEDEVWQHLWVTGSPLDLPGDPRMVADVTADQFGDLPVLVACLPRQGYRARVAPRQIERLREHEMQLVQTLQALVLESDLDRVAWASRMVAQAEEARS